MVGDLGIALTVDTPGEAGIAMDLDGLGDDAECVVVAAALPAPSTFADVGAIEVRLADPDGRMYARATLDAATTEQSLHLATVCRRRGAWRLRMVGQGDDFGLADLMRLHGAEVDD